MANKTPTKDAGNIEITYSPITLQQSPGYTSKNLTGLPRVAKDIAADVYNSVQKWNDSHIQGASIVKQIVNLKCNNKKKYPNGLEELIDELAYLRGN
ncbi:tun [Trypoxylus dichotomus]